MANGGGPHHGKGDQKESSAQKSEERAREARLEQEPTKATAESEEARVSVSTQ